MRFKAMFAALMVGMTPASSGELLSRDQVGNWSIVCTSQDSGAFSHCTMSTRFEARNRSERERLRSRAVDLWFAQNETDLSTFTMLITGDDWRVTDREYSVEVAVSDGTYKWPCRGIPSEQMVKCQFVTSDRIQWQDVSEKGYFDITIDGHRLGRLSLSGSRKALAAMMQRFKSHYDRLGGRGESFGPRRGNVDPQETF